MGSYLKPTFVPDETATALARDEAAAAVKPVEVKRGDVIVRQGESVSKLQYDLLYDLDLVRAGRSDTMLDVGAALFFALHVCRICCVSRIIQAACCGKP